MALNEHAALAATRGSSRKGVSGHFYYVARNSPAQDVDGRFCATLPYGLGMPQRKPHKPRGPGRPPEVGEPRTETVRIRLTPDERLDLEKAAAKRGKRLSAWARAVLLRSAQGRQ